MTSSPITTQQIEGKKWRQWQIFFPSAPKSLWTVTAAMKLKDTCSLEGFPCGSAGKESACNERDLGSMPGLGRSPGEGKGYSGLKNSMYCIVHGVAKSWTWLSNFHFAPWRASLVAQMIKCLPAMQETWVQCLGWEDLLEKEMATYSSTLAWRIPRTEEPGRQQSTGSQRVRHDWVSALLSAIRVVSSAYLRLVIFLLAILIPACDSSSPAFLTMYSAYVK